MARAATLLLAAALLFPAAARASTNLLANPGFSAAEQLGGWDLGNANASWSSLDLDAAPDSGSLRIDNFFLDPGFSFEVSQCVLAGPGRYEVGAWYLVPAGQADVGFGSVRWSFHEGAACEGPPTGFGQLAPQLMDVVPGVWSPISSAGRDVEAPAATGSARITLINRRESGEAVFTVHLDAASLWAAPEPDAAGSTAALALAALAARRYWFRTAMRAERQDQPPPQRAGWKPPHPRAPARRGSDPSAES